MREIKFRAWNKISKEMATVQSIDNMNYSNGHIHKYICTDKGVWQWQKIILMQFTGLKDKGGKENYHKDILDWDGNRFVVEWDDDSGMWYGKPMAGNKERGVLAGLAFSNTLNIGNVHEHPELPEEKK